MKAWTPLLWYLMTWLRPLFWFACLGLALLCSVIVFAILGKPDIAFGMAIYTFGPLLVLPYIVAWYPFRVMLASRRFTLLPGFRLRLGLVMLLFTLLLALFLPLASLLFWPGVVPLRLALAIFLAASLFTWLMQWAIASPQAVLIYSLGPFFVIYLISQGGPLFQLAFTRDTSVLLLLLVGVLGWGLALQRISSRRDFRAPVKAPLHARDYVWDGRSDWLGVLLLNYRGSVKSAEGTLLLGYPDGGRFFQLFNLAVISPMVGILGLLVINMSPSQNGLGTLPDLFLGFSLGSSLIAGLGNGELAARCRLVWLRQGGNRAEQWQRIERHVFFDIALLALITFPIMGVALMFFANLSVDPLTYCVMVLVGNILTNYFSLAARLSQWSMLLQFFIGIVMVVSLVISRVLDLLPLAVVVLIVLGLAALFRLQARQRFIGVDWYLLRPACQPFKGKLS